MLFANVVAESFKSSLVCSAGVRSSHHHHFIHPIVMHTYTIPPVSQKSISVRICYTVKTGQAVSLK